MMLSHSRRPKAARAYATFNPSLKGSAITLSDGNLTAGTTGSSPGLVLAGPPYLSYVDRYWEVTIKVIGAVVGMGTASANLNNYPGATGESFGLFRNGEFYAGGVMVESSDAYRSFAVGDVIGVRCQSTSLFVYFYRNGSMIYRATLPSYLSIAPLIGGSYAAGSATANFGDSPFSYAVPAGSTRGWPMA